MGLSSVAIAVTETTVLLASADISSVTIWFCNTTSGDLILDIHLIASGGGSAGSGNIAYKQITVPAEDTYILDLEKIVMASGDKVSAIASSVGITASISSIAL